MKITINKNNQPTIKYKNTYVLTANGYFGDMDYDYYYEYSFDALDNDSMEYFEIMYKSMYYVWKYRNPYKVRTSEDLMKLIPSQPLKDKKSWYEFPSCSLHDYLPTIENITVEYYDENGRLHNDITIDVENE